MIQLNPEYEFFTHVEVKFYLGGNRENDSRILVVTLSKLGEYFNSLSIKEGVPDSGSEQLVTEPGGSIVSGTLQIYDTDLLIFNSLILSYSNKNLGEELGEVQRLETHFDILIKTYTGERAYNNCRVVKWNIGFSGGVPVIRFDWQSIKTSLSNSDIDESQPSYNYEELVNSFVKQGVKSFKEFKEAFKKGFSDEYTFKYSKSMSYDISQLEDVGDDGKLVYFNGDTTQPYTIDIPTAVKQRSAAGETLRYTSIQKSVNDSNSLMVNIMNQFCHAINTDASKGLLQWKFIPDKNIILLYVSNGYLDIITPSANDGHDYLGQSVFIYNSSLKQGSIFKTPSGEEKTVFVIENLGATVSNENTLNVNFNEQANADNPNGNTILTSGGTVFIPSGIPQIISQSIRRLSSILFTEELSVTMDVYNFIQFYVNGTVLADIIVYDHLGQVLNVLTGKMRVAGYEYSIGEGGVIKAHVTLKQAFPKPYDNSVPASSNPSSNTTSATLETSYQIAPVNENGTETKADIGLYKATGYYGIHR